MRSLALAGALFLIAAAPAFAGGGKAACEGGLRRAYHELNAAKAKGLGGTWEVTKAATLLAGAKIQSEFGKYPNCIEKVRRARAFIARSTKK